MNQLPPHDQPQGIADLIRAWSDAWNAHDMEHVRSLLADDVDFVTVAGLWLKGGDEFVAYHRDIHRTHMRDSRWTNLGYELRPVGNDLCVVHLEWTIAGDRDPDGTPRSRRYGLFTWLIQRCDGAWRIAAVHNGNLRADVRHRLSGSLNVCPSRQGGAS